MDVYQLHAAACCFASGHASPRTNRPSCLGCCRRATPSAPLQPLVVNRRPKIGRWSEVGAAQKLGSRRTTARIRHNRRSCPATQGSQQCRCGHCCTCPGSARRAGAAADHAVSRRADCAAGVRSSRGRADGHFGVVPDQEQAASVGGGAGVVPPSRTVPSTCPGYSASRAACGTRSGAAIAAS